jgi:hypothetical protein
MTASTGELQAEHVDNCAPRSAQILLAAERPALTPASGFTQRQQPATAVGGRRHCRSRRAGAVARAPSVGFGAVACGHRQSPGPGAYTRAKAKAAPAHREGPQARFARTALGASGRSELAVRPMEVSLGTRFWCGSHAQAELFLELDATRRVMLVAGCGSDRVKLAPRGRRSRRSVPG